MAYIVRGCSDTFKTPKPAWKARKEEYLDHLRGETSPSVFLVSVADQVHNLRSIVEDYRRVGEELWERFTGKKDGTLWYYGALLEVYQEKAPARCRDLVEELERLHRQLAEAAGQEEVDPGRDLDETEGYPPLLLEERWEGGRPIEAIRAAQADSSGDQQVAAQDPAGEGSRTETAPHHRYAWRAAA